MKKTRFIWLIMLLWCALPAVMESSVYGQKVWSEVSLNRSSVYLGQPVEVRIVVYTSTWFTSGIDPGNIKVNGAFTTYFRPVSKSFTKDSQTYAGVELIYNVFPFKEENITFPVLDLTVESPAEGEYKGREIKLKTQAKSIRVKHIPDGVPRDEWLVATGLQVNQNWSSNADSAKVGDVWVRKINRSVQGTMASLVPPTIWDSIPGISEYPLRSEMDDQESKTAISASRLDQVQYLFEKPGTVTFPAITYYYYHARNEKLYKRTLPERKVIVRENPDLGMLLTLKDSLQATAAVTDEVTEDQPFSLFGLNWKQLIFACLGLAIAIFMLIKLILNLWGKWKKHHAAYLVSEAYFWKMLKKSFAKGGKQEISKSLYRWVDELPRPESSVGELVFAYADQGLQRNWRSSVQQKVDTARYDAEVLRFLQQLRPFVNGPKKVIVKDSSQSWVNP
ncbi:BatD family protein [Echinicola pacifica]|nr:BatD family protein [Echinicola pacifica]